MKVIHFYAPKRGTSFVFHIGTLLLLITGFIAAGFRAQAQCPGSALTLSSQAEVDNFASDYPGCFLLPVSLTISGSDITNLNGLSVLNEFDNSFANPSLTIESNPVLTNLTGLSGLSFIPGGLTIFDNGTLANLNGLNNITSIGFSLNVESNTQLTSLGALSGVNSIGGDLYVAFNPALTSFGGGLNLVPSLGGILQIQNNGALTTLNGLNALTSVSQYLFISSNVSLTSLSSLANLASVGQDFEISGNASMTTLGGFSNLTTVGGNFSIEQNGALTNLNQLANLSSIGGNLSINFNAQLSNCAAQGICDYIATPNGNILIGGNAGACVNQAAVEAACGLLPVELIDFKAVIHQHDIQLVWRTASEQENLGYSLQRSADGHSWSEIGFVQGQGSTIKQSDYSWMDKNPISGVNYYRLKQMDNDGKYEFSPIVVADMRSTGTQFDIFPNPSIDGAISLRATTSTEGRALLEIMDTNGKKVYDEKIGFPEGTVIYPVSLAAYPKGVYTARLELPDGQVQFKKIVLQ